MHGVIFASFGDYVAARLGPATARRIMADEPLYLMSEAYDDARLFELIERVAREADLPETDVVHEFGIFAAETTFARLYPAFFAVAGSARGFMLTVEERIHELVRATIPNARPPQLGVVPLGADGVRVTYTSRRQLCVLLRGLVEGTARHYGSAAAIVETECMREGASACLFDVRFTSAPAV
ncbi:MAG: heme NO-binding domain-containing protein [Actinobacteria bacterium]|nr:heme NO-binding domain-containing protein [Actinomycetota bacterium]